ncbi:ESX secretion-associated protein EspG [Mycobacterium kiyosense]|uniref:ESX secretion-associated protein EspG n=1 Tax=Mycobacterium kiyosense TaxID=2871094 RepID=UPI0022313FC2|nr:ESX secretion-associated protein EspG [Mycobacterium kiyosense]
MLDLGMISNYLGREFLPFPFVPTLPNRFADFGAYNAHARTLPDRVNHGDLKVFKTWFATYAEADVRVECRVQYFPVHLPSTRLLAHRCGDRGFLASQHSDDVVELFALSPYDLGPAIAGMVELTRPGPRPRVVIPEYVPQSLRDSKEVAAQPNWGSGPVIDVPSAEVTAYATVQSHRLPARAWGLDQDTDAVVWVRIKDDGEYIYNPDYRWAQPMTRRYLSERIDNLIAADIAAVRRQRE